MPLFRRRSAAAGSFAGGVLTTPLILAGDAVVDLGAVSKRQLDASTVEPLGVLSTTQAGAGADIVVGFARGAVAFPDMSRLRFDGLHMITTSRLGATASVDSPGTATIAAPAANSTYWIYLNNDGTFAVSAAGAPPVYTTGRVLLAKVTTDGAKVPTTFDMRGLLQPVNTSKVVAANVGTAAAPLSTLINDRLTDQEAFSLTLPANSVSAKDKVRVSASGDTISTVALNPTFKYQIGAAVFASLPIAVSANPARRNWTLVFEIWFSALAAQLTSGSFAITTPASTTSFRTNAGGVGATLGAVESAADSTADIVIRFLIAWDALTANADFVTRQTGLEVVRA